MFGIDLFKLNIEDKKKIAKLLNTDSETLKKFEDAYAKSSLVESDNFFKLNAKQMASHDERFVNVEELTDLQNRIVNELIANTTITYTYNREQNIDNLVERTSLPLDSYVSNDELKTVDVSVRPELTGQLMKIDTPNANNGYMLLSLYLESLKSATESKRKSAYGRFRQGLDLLDLDYVMYEMLSLNQNSMMYWLPKMVKMLKNSTFMIPNTKIVKIPMSLLQLTRLSYETHNRTTLNIVDDYCMKIFDLDLTKQYFIKTGTYSSKFDFRNAKITEPKEIREIGEYLLFIQTQANTYSHYDLSGRNQPIIFGVSTTNDWVVREFIKPKDDDDLTIYHGLPLHTEYRLFVDFDSRKVLGIHSYWDSDVMTKRFNNGTDANEPDMIHDSITFFAQKDKLEQRYNENKDFIVNSFQEILDTAEIDLQGQWSIDIMQNEDDFWFIDMAIAENSMFYNETVAIQDRHPIRENWIPNFKGKG